MLVCIFIKKKFPCLQVRQRFIKIIVRLYWVCISNPLGKKLIMIGERFNKT